MKKEKIIKAPERLSPARRHGETTLKILFNLLLTVFAVVSTVALWGASGVHLYEMLFSPEYLQKTIDILIFLSIISFVAFVMMFGWQQYNFRVFGKKERRAFPSAIPDERLAGMYNTELEDINTLRNSKIVWLERQGEEGSLEERKILTNEKGEQAILGGFNPHFKYVEQVKQVAVENSKDTAEVEESATK